MCSTSAVATCVPISIVRRGDSGDDHYQLDLRSIEVLCVLEEVPSRRRSEGLVLPSVGRTERGSGRYGVTEVVKSAKDQRVGARMSASQPKTTRGRTW
jgi:hypothetical protein